jgi:hypothetical protein
MEIDDPAADPRIATTARPLHERLLKPRSRPEAGSTGLSVDHDDGALEGTTASSGRRSMVAIQASKNALASGRVCSRVKR